jgi:hypothetical protein
MEPTLTDLLRTLPDGWARESVVALLVPRQRRPVGEAATHGEANSREDLGARPSQPLDGNGLSF